jgi:hypothetical protein
MMQTFGRTLRVCIAFWLASRYSFLFYTLLLTIVVSPLLAAFGFDGQPILQIFLLVNLAAALAGITNRRWAHLLLAIFIIAITVHFYAFYINAQKFQAASTVVLVILAFIAASDAVQTAMKSSEITGENLYAALSAYMIAGIFFGVLHWTVGQVWPGSYIVPEDRTMSLHEAVYFSFVTQATLGYGDVLPKSEIARGLAVIQAVAGQFYLAVMVARLVSLYVSNAAAESKSKRL